MVARPEEVYALLEVREIDQARDSALPSAPGEALSPLVSASLDPCRTHVKSELNLTGNGKRRGRGRGDRGPERGGRARASGAGARGASAGASYSIARRAGVVRFSAHGAFLGTVRKRYAIAASGLLRDARLHGALGRSVAGAIGAPQALMAPTGPGASLAGGEPPRHRGHGSARGGDGGGDVRDPTFFSALPQPPGRPLA